MATSGSYNFSTTRDELIENALLKIGGIGQGETPSTDQYTEGAFNLNLIVKAWEADGMPLWAIKEVGSGLIEAQANYTVGPACDIPIAHKPLKVYQAWLKDNTSLTDQPVEVISRQEYEALTSKSAQGQPIKLFYDPRGGANGSTGMMYLWPTAEAAVVTNKTLYFSYQRPFEDFDAATDEPDFPQEWFMALLYQLAWALAPSYGVPLEERKLLMIEAEKLHKDAKDFGMEEGSMYIEPQTS